MALTKIHSTDYWVLDRRQTVWGQEVLRQNYDYVLRIDPDYFSYQADVHVAQLEGEHGLRAALALRQLFHQGVEAAMSYVGATLQAPNAVHAWIPLCKTNDMLEFLRRVEARGHLCNRFGLKYLDWEGIAKAILREEDVAKLHAKWWQAWARTFLDTDVREEYNAIKHGHRVNSGGTQWAMQLGTVDNPPTAGTPWTALSGSKHGSQFMKLEPISFQGNEANGSTHNTPRSVSLNWDPMPHAVALHAISASIHNLRQVLIYLNDNAKTPQFRRPVAGGEIYEPWMTNPFFQGKMNLTINLPIDERTATQDAATLLKSACTEHPKG